jgi:hypothetical protein
VRRHCWPRRSRRCARTAPARPAACGPAQGIPDPSPQGAGLGSRGRSGIIIFAFDPTRSALLLKDLAAALGVSIARISQIEHGDMTSFEVIAQYVEALGGRLDLFADFGDRTVRLPVSDTAHAA